MINNTAEVTPSTNLFSSDYTTGNLYQISSITNVLGTFACWVISVVGFGIVIFSILKNAMSGLYCVNPNFWDKVDEVKTTLANEIDSDFKAVAGHLGRGNVVVSKVGGLLVFLINLMPNIKSLTDFDEAPVDKKQYFMRSLPLCVAQIFIGMFIFFGYPAQVANWVGTAGTQVIDMVLNNVDPVETVASLGTKLAIVKFSTDGSENPYDVSVNKGAQAMYTAAVSYASDTEKGPRQTAAYEIEGWVSSTFAKHADILGAEEGYDIGVNATYNSGEPTVAGEGWSSDGNNVYITSSKTGTVRIISWMDMSAMKTGSAKVKAGDYVKIEYTATPVASKGNTNLTVVVQDKIGTVKMTANGLSIELPSFSYSKTKTNKMISGTPGTSVNIDFLNSDGTIINSYSGTVQAPGDKISFVIGTATATAANTDRQNAKGGIRITMNNANKLNYNESTNSGTNVSFNITAFELDSKYSGTLKLSNSDVDKPGVKPGEVANAAMNATKSTE